MVMYLEKVQVFTTALVGQLPHKTICKYSHYELKKIQCVEMSFKISEEE